MPVTDTKFTLGNIVDLGHHIEPFTASEELSIHNTYDSHPNLHHHESQLPTSYQNTFQENSFKYLPVESSLIYDHKKEFIPASFEKKAPLDHFFTNEKFPEHQFGRNIEQNFLEPYHDDPVKAPPEEELPPHKPFVALGSGSLGATKLPNGQIVIGSGSLGYGGANSNNNNQGNNIGNPNNNNQFGRNLGSNFETVQENSFSSNLFKPARLESLPQGESTNGFPYFIN